MDRRRFLGTSTAAALGLGVQPLRADHAQIYL